MNFDEKYNKNDVSTRFTQYKKKKFKPFKRALNLI